ncbi:hypothetical protein WLF18_11380 [Pseudomonas shirazensis]|uniref:Holin-X, holin superfamily III n=1 Tax=Pseudomonas shirazensis TaxID=2745494 RepID=A0ABU9A172_9PSED
MTDKEVFEEAPVTRDGEPHRTTFSADAGGGDEGRSYSSYVINQVTNNGPDEEKKNWKDALSSAQHVKEFLVILAVGGALVWLLSILSGFIGAISALFTEAVLLHSAPIAVVKTMDWHVVLIGTTLTVGIAAILIVLLKSVFDSGKTEKKTSDGLALNDMPFGEVVKSIVSFFKK